MTEDRVPCPCVSHTGEYCDGWSAQPAPPIDWDRVNAILDDHAVPSTPAEWDSLRRALVEAERLGSGDD